MRFDKLPIGAKFVHSVTSNGKVFIFRKKSKSSGYVLDPISLEPTHLTVTFARCDTTGSILGFGGAVQVHPLAEENPEPIVILETGKGLDQLAKRYGLERKPGPEKDADLITRLILMLRAEELQSKQPTDRP